MYGNPIGQVGAKALRNAIINNKKLEKFSLCSEGDINENPIDEVSAMIIIRSLYNNNTIIKVYLDITLYENDVSLVTREVEKINSIRQSHNERIIDFDLSFYDQKGFSCGEYTTINRTYRRLQDY